MSPWLLLLISFGYLLLLFMIAYWGERKAVQGKSLVNNPWVYTCSLAVYCTAWTYFGSVGRSVESGMDFLTIYIGPTLGMPIWWMVMQKTIVICRSRNITSIADFISARYGNSRGLGLLVTFVSVIGIIPYISLQLKAVSDSFSVLTETTATDTALWNGNAGMFQDTGFLVMIILMVFTILFGTRNIQASERHEGLVTAIAFESLLKLLAFLLLGVYVVYVIFNGFGDIIQQTLAVPTLDKVFRLPEEGSYTQWFLMCMLSWLAFMFLPRQFQVAVIENVNTAHLRKAIWLFPLYLLLINVFVLPIALSGKLLLSPDMPPDTYVLALPMSFDQEVLSVLVYLGGFSAASSMIVVSTMALTVMLSNNLIMPVLLSIPTLKKHYTTQLGNILVYLRRFCIVLILHIAYLFAVFVVDERPLVSIGLISFVAIAQFAPSMLGGIYWRRGNRYGAYTGILLGALVWCYTLVVPLFISISWIPETVLENGPWGWYWLRPQALFGLETLDPISHGFFWSMLLNGIAYIGLSLWFMQEAEDANQAEVFVNIYAYAEEEGVFYWKAEAKQQELIYILENFLGKATTQQALERYAKSQGKTRKKEANADAGFIAFCEKLLAGAIGAVAARIMISSVVRQKHEIRVETVLKILKESQELIALNQALQEKSEALEQASEELRQINENLKEMDQRKNEFISTVTHELRTPITSIRAFSEILYDNDDIELREKKQFLETIIKETHRTERLINQVLELERLETGDQVLNLSVQSINALIHEALGTFEQTIREKDIQLQVQLDSSLPELHIDRDRIMQVIINLLSNAIKFCKKDAGNIEVATRRGANQVEIYVLDNGRGIQKELHELIFEKFFQAKDQNIRKPKGSGLGLAISKKIMLSHQGDIFIDSKVGEYTKMVLMLPLPTTEKCNVTWFSLYALCTQ